MQKNKKTNGRGIERKKRRNGEGFVQKKKGIQQSVEDKERWIQREMVKEVEEDKSMGKLWKQLGTSKKREKISKQIDSEQWKSYFRRQYMIIEKREIKKEAELEKINEIKKKE